MQDLLNLTKLSRGGTSEPRRIPEWHILGRDAPLLSSRDPLHPVDKIEFFVMSILFFSHSGVGYNMGISGCVILVELLNLSGSWFNLQWP